MDSSHMDGRAELLPGCYGLVGQSHEPRDCLDATSRDVWLSLGSTHICGLRHADRLVPIRVERKLARGRGGLFGKGPRADGVLQNYVKLQKATEIG
ncbi:hypothetical protein AVEN_12875-1 [Araneus ventricosus]|uniref:Uncharacterized protein n=1 Tax=Araneus ventricosus TaxID=182803 RepID=A0A4Y1ZUM5_ARAVE|nr:hypothetical protein AVEN_12875-1 [Araneus ventricosus]